MTADEKQPLFTLMLTRLKALFVTDMQKVSTKIMCNKLRIFTGPTKYIQHKIQITLLVLRSTLHN